MTPAERAATTIAPPAGPLLCARCGCGKTYDEVGWAHLANPRMWNLDGAWLVLRDCSCGSTISREAE